MSSRVGTAIPASFSTALSSTWVGLKRSIHTALSGSFARSSQEAFFREPSEGTKTESMGHSGQEMERSQTGRGRLLQAGNASLLTGNWYLWRSGGRKVARIRRPAHICPRISPKRHILRQKRHN